MTPHRNSLPPLINIPSEKFCSRCKYTKQSLEFYTNRARHDGLAVYCKKCHIEVQHDRSKIEHTPKHMDIYIVCAGCGVSKIATEFRRNPRLLSGLMPICIICIRAREKTWKANHPETRKKYDNEHKERKSIIAKRYNDKNQQKTKERTARFHENNPEWRAEYYKSKKLNDPEYIRELNLRKHSVTREWYEEKLAAQHGVCEICGTSDPGGTNRRFAIDHDHSCCSHGNGKSCEKCRRGLLCLRCNVWIDRLERTPGLAKRALAYLAKHSKEENAEYLPLPLFVDD